MGMGQNIEVEFEQRLMDEANKQGISVEQLRQKLQRPDFEMAVQALANHLGVEPEKLLSTEDWRINGIVTPFGVITQSCLFPDEARRFARYYMAGKETLLPPSLLSHLNECSYCTALLERTRAQMTALEL